MTYSLDPILVNFCAACAPPTWLTSSSPTRDWSFRSSPKWFFSLFFQLSLALTVVQQLNVEIAEVEELLIGLILEGKVDGRIDQVGMRLELDQRWEDIAVVFLLRTSYWLNHSHVLEKKRYAALERWTETLEGLHSTVAAKTAAGARGDPMMGMPPERFPPDFGGATATGF